LAANLMRGFEPVVDGDTLGAHPFDPVASPSTRSAPIIVGHTRTEMTPFLDGPALSPDERGMTERTGLLGPRAVSALPAYRERHQDASPARLLAYLHSDVVMLPFAPTIA
jgi:para-nitrobenzyl esterase